MTVPFSEVTEDFKNGSSFIVVDIRSADLYAYQRVVGSINFPFRQVFASPTIVGDLSTQYDKGNS